jgi:hypothetical protein
MDALKAASHKVCTTMKASNARGKTSPHASVLAKRCSRQSHSAKGKTKTDTINVTGHAQSQVARGVAANNKGHNLCM